MKTMPGTSSSPTIAEIRKLVVRRMRRRNDLAADRSWLVQNISGASAEHVMFVDISAGTPTATSWHFPNYVYEGVAAVDGRTAWVAGFRSVGAAPELPRGSVLRTVNGTDWSLMPMPDPDFELWKISVVGARR